MVATSGSTGERSAVAIAKAVDVAALDLRNQIDDLVAAIVDLTGDEIVQRRPRAAIGNARRPWHR